MIRAALGSLVCLLLGAGSLAFADTPSPRVAFEERLTDSPSLAATWPKPAATDLPVMVRLVVDARLLDPDTAGRYHADALTQRLQAYRDKGVKVWLAIDGIPQGPPTASVGGRAEAPLFRRLLDGRLAGSPIAIIELLLPETIATPADVAFYLKRASIELHGADPALQIAAGLRAGQDAQTLESLYTPDLAPYVDAVVAPQADRDALAPELRRLLDRVDPTARVFERGLTLTGTPAEAARTFTTAALWQLGGPSVLAAFQAPTADTARAVLRQADALRYLLGGEIAKLDDRASTLAIERAPASGASAPASVPAGARAALVYNLTTFGSYLIYAGAADDTGSVRVSLTLASGARPLVRDPYSGEVKPAADFTRDADTRRTSFTAPLRARPLVIDFNDAVDGIITERSDVNATADLSVDEIIARHQQAQAAQDIAVRSYSAAVRMEQHFRPSAADAGYDIVTENRFFVDDESLEWEELSFSVNGATWKANRPAFPLLQPEKVLSVPLKLRLTADYRYRLDGRGTVDGHECYVVHFDPLDSARSLYRGTVWIDTRTFVRRKLQAVQTNLTAPIVSNEETHEFSEVTTLDGHPVLLPTRMIAKQILLIAGRNVLLEKATTFADYQINAEGFQEGRAAARASDRIMYRDTDRGVRYLVKEPNQPQRVVSERMTARAKAMAMGVNIDPSYDFPLPIFGINYLDFNFRGPDSQLALLFAGVLALGNVQKPKLLGTKLDGSVDFFGIAVPSNDRIYDADGNRKQDELLSWTESAGGNLGYQFTSFQKVTGQYQFQFNGYAKNRETTADYHVPSTTVTHGLGLAYEYRRAGYSIVANGTWYGRMSWKPWGQADNLQTTPRTYEKYSLNVSKDWYVGLFHKIHANGAYFGGNRLDRFSQYQFGMFDDTRIHGVPGAGVRYNDIAMARGSYSFNLFEQYRFDLFVEQAFGRDKVASGGLALAQEWDPVTGVGVAFSVKAPFNTLLRADVGKAFLPDRYRATGSTVISVLFLKPL